MSDFSCQDASIFCADSLGWCFLGKRESVLSDVTAFAVLILLDISDTIWRTMIFSSQWINHTFCCRLYPYNGERTMTEVIVTFPLREMRPHSKADFEA